MIGIENVNEYYTNHYVAAILGTDVRPFLEQWKEEAADEAEEAPTQLPWRRLSRLQRDFFQVKDRLERRRDPTERVELHRGIAFQLLEALGYVVAPTHGWTPSGWLPMLGAWRRSDGAPLMWIVPAAAQFSEDESDTGDLLSRSLLPEQHDIDREPPEDLDREVLAGRSVEDLVSEIFGMEEPPRFVLVVGDGEWILADRGKWAEQRLLRFDWAELLGRRDMEALQAVTALLHHDALVPDSGTPLVDSLDESSHKHAYGVSEDLKYALRDCIERIGNEAIRYRRQESKKKVFGDEIDGQHLAIECIRYMYRLLFLLYVEARPELGYAPIGEPSYDRGYSFDRLRDLETVELDSDEDRNGFYIHECLEKLFRMVYDGTETVRGQQPLQFARRPDTEGGDTSLHNTFRLVPLRSHLFDPERTPFLSKLRLRNEVLLEVVKAMSLSRASGKFKRRGRISYATLGINQLGEVYEALLSFRGFFAEETLYEVKPAGDKAPDPVKDVAYFVPEADLKQYKKNERVFEDTGEPRSYEPGAFIYRMAGRDREKSASYYTPEVLTKCLVKYALKELLEDKDGNPKYEKAEDLLKLTVCEPAMGSAAFLNEAINQISERYLQARQKELEERIPHDQYLPELQRVRMYLADNNVFGVDLNPVAVELAEVSLWLNAIFTQKTDKGPEVFVPWFGGQLTCGNSLVGAGRSVFSSTTLRAGKKGDEVAWLDAVPDRVKLGTKRTKGAVYHFLLPDRGMATYGDGAEGKPIRERWGDELARIDEWRKEACRPLSKDDLEVFSGLAAAIDRLWAKHAELLARIRERTTDPLSVYGRDHLHAGRPPTTTEHKDRIWKQEMVSEQIRASSPYRRLKLAMDYWCALWFWPIEKADLLPDREEWLADLAMLLEPGVLPGLVGGGDQRELFAPTMAADTARTLVEEVGFADVERLVERSERLQVADALSSKHRFLHWELEYADLFTERGGFDLVVGNPPWIPLRWDELHVLADFDPSFLVHKVTATAAAEKRQSSLKSDAMRGHYLAGYEEAEGRRCFFTGRQNYPWSQDGVRTNLYKCFIQRVDALREPADGVVGLLHPEGVYDDPNGGPLRGFIYQRLRAHYQFQNALNLFPVAHRSRFSINIYGPVKRAPDFISLANLFSPSTIEQCFESREGEAPGLKDIANAWCTEGHPDRVLRVGAAELKLFRDLLDAADRPPEEARLPAVHTRQWIGVLRSLAASQHRVGGIENWTASAHVHETHAQRDGLIRRDTSFPSSASEAVLSGPHFYVATPLYKTPRRVCTEKGQYDVLDLVDLPADYFPRTNFVPASKAYHSRAPTLPWDSNRRVLDCYRLVAREAVGPASERTLQAAIIPPGPGHIHKVYAYAFEKDNDLLRCAASWMSLPLDFLLKTAGVQSFLPNVAAQLPICPDLLPEAAVRVLLLNCLTEHYSELWEACFQRDFRTDEWTRSDPRLGGATYRGLQSAWSTDTPLRDSFSRRQALVELDVLVAMTLGLSLQELASTYRGQFPVLCFHESDTWYDRRGRIVFTNSRGLSGVGLPRKRSAAHPHGPYWEDVKHMSEEAGHTGDVRVKQVVADDTLPGGLQEKTITYETPWVRCDREHEYGLAWKHFERRFGKVKAQ